MTRYSLQTLCVTGAASTKDEMLVYKKVEESHPFQESIVSPICTSTIYRFPNEAGTVYYPRSFNTPSQIEVANKIAALEHCEAGLVLSSGTAAITTTLLTWLRSGDHLLISGEIYSGTRSIVDTILKKFGIQVTVVYEYHLDAFKKALQPNTKLLFVETPTNPLLNILPIAELAALCKEHNILSIVDNTMASPINQNPAVLGIDVVIHSGTKYLNGHSDLICGTVTSTKANIERISADASQWGCVADPTTCAQLNRSIKTLSVRVERQNQSAQFLAEWLSKHPRVRNVYYPGLTSHHQYELACSQMHTGFGGVLSFDVISDLDPDSVLKKLQLILPANSFGGIESTISRPYYTSHRKIDVSERHALGIYPNLFRISVGIEDLGDLIKDLELGLG